jgi:hypothetical protein
LIALGDLSSLGETVGTKTDFSNPADGQCVAYGRDRGEKDVDAKTCADWAALLEDFGQEFDYLFTPGAGWTVRYFSGWDNAEQSLSEALEKDAQEA